MQKMRLTFCLFFFIFCFQVYSQDVIRLQYGDSITGKVVEITGRDVKYIKSSYPDGPVYFVSKCRVFYIQYENGNKDYIRKDLSKSKYIPYLTFSVLNSQSDFFSQNALGLGHEGFIDVGKPKKFGIIYNFNFKSDFDGNYMIGINSGIEYRHRLTEGSGLFSNAKLGFLASKSSGYDIVWISSIPVFTIGTGVYFPKLKIEISYSYGTIKTVSDFSFENFYVRRNKYNLDMVQLGLGFKL